MNIATIKKTSLYSFIGSLSILGVIGIIAIWFEAENEFIGKLIAILALIAATAFLVFIGYKIYEFAKSKEAISATRMIFYFLVIFFGGGAVFYGLVMLAIIGIGISDPYYY